MGKLKFKPTNYLYNVLVLAMVFALFGINAAYAVPAGIVTGTLMSRVDLKAISMCVTIQKHIWENDIQENLYKGNAFLNTFSKADKGNINGIVVHIPQAGKGGDVVKNRTQLPAEVKKRTDTIASYQIDEFTSDPMLIPNADTVELSYDKRQSVLQDEQANLNEHVAESLLLSMVKSPYGAGAELPASSILMTDESAPEAPSTAPGSEGTVRAYRIDDLQKARSFFKRQKIWTEGKMYALLTAEAEAQMFPAGSQVTATYMASVTEEERRNGVMYKAHGFQIISRSTVLTLDASGAFKPSTSESEGDDVEGVFFYNGNQVEFALGDVHFFANDGDPQFYGDIYSFLVRAGGRAKRAGFEGLMVMKQRRVS